MYHLQNECVEEYASLNKLNIDVKEYNYMLKIKMLIVVLISFGLICVIGCSKTPEKMIVGYWVSSDQKSSVSFDEKGVVVVDDKYVGKYSVFNNNQIAINVDTSLFDDVYDLVMSAEFSVDDDILVIRNVENGNNYRFYSEKKAISLKNDEYAQRKMEDEDKQYVCYPIAYPDDWDPPLDSDKYEGEEFEGAECLYNALISLDFDGSTDKEKLKNGSLEAEKMAESKIVKLYQNSSMKGEYKFCCYCESAVLVWDTICFKVSIGCEDMVGRVCSYVINPKSGDIYLEDEEGFLQIWDGTIKGQSLIEKIDF